MKIPVNLLAAGALAAMLMVPSAVAQPGQGRPDPSQMVDRQLSMMKEHLKLTDEQEQKVKPILADSVKRMVEAREKSGGGRPSQEMMAEMRKNREETNKQLSEVLSKDQMAEYVKMQNQRGPRGGGGGRGPRGNQ